MVLDLVVFWRNQLDQSTPCVSTELNKRELSGDFLAIGYICPFVWYNIEKAKRLRA